MKIYGIKTCDSVRKALKFFKTHHIAYEFIDLKQTKIDESHILQWLTHVEMKTLFNTRGTTYRTLKLKDLNLDEKQKVTWLARENMLIKRPVIEYRDDVIVAYDKQRYIDTFL